MHNCVLFQSSCLFISSCIICIATTPINKRPFMIPTLKCEKQKQTYPHKHIPPQKKNRKKKILIRKKRPRKNTKRIYFHITFPTKILLCTHSQGELQINIDKISQKKTHISHITIFPSSYK